MTKNRAKEIALILGGEVIQGENEDWVVLIERADGRVVVVSGSSVEEYPDRESVAGGRCYASISLT